MVLFNIRNFSFGNYFQFSSSLQLVEHMLSLVVTQALYVRHPRFGITAYRRINRYLQYRFEIKWRDWAKRGLSVPSKQKITLACVACLCYKSRQCTRVT